MKNNKLQVCRLSILNLFALLFALLMPAMAFGGNAPSLKVGGPHIMPLIDPAARKAAAPAVSAHLNYYGGRVVTDLQVVQVLWGSGSYLSQVSSTADPSMATFYDQVLNSSYLDWLVEYDTATTPFVGGQGTNQNIQHGAFVDQFTITPSVTSSTVTDDQIRAELASQIIAGNLPTPTNDAQGNAHTYYAVFFPHGIVINLDGSLSCQIFCAYHGTVASVMVGGKSYEFYYGVHPDMQSGSGCESGCGTAAQPFGNYTSVASHEMIETITDPEVGIANVFGPPLAWYDPNNNNGEIGDICNANQGSVVGPNDGVTYVVQKEWSNRLNSCITSSSTTPDYTLSVAPSSANLAPGATATFSVTANIKSGSPGSITLGAVGLPSGVTPGFVPSSFTPNGSSTLTLTATGGATLGSKTFTVTSSGGINHSALASVNVTSATATATATPTATPTATVTPSPTVLTLAPLSFNFHNVQATGSSKPHSFTVTNKGSAPAVIDSLNTAAAPASSFQVSLGTCASSLDPKKSCKISVTFAPLLADGPETGTLTLSYNGGQVDAALVGNATKAALTASPKTENLNGAKPGATGPAKSIKITNHSDVSIQLGASPTFGPDFGESGLLDTCTNAILAKGQSCSVSVEAKPTPGTLSGQLLSEPMSYPFSYGSNPGNVSITLKSKVL